MCLKKSVDVDCDICINIGYVCYLHFWSTDVPGLRIRYRQDSPNKSQVPSDEKSLRVESVDWAFLQPFSEVIRTLLVEKSLPV